MGTKNRNRIIMKKLLTISLLCLLALNALAQDYAAWPQQPQKEKIPQWVKVTTIYTASIVLDAVADATRDDGNKQLSHALEAASVGVLLASPFVVDYDKSKWGWYLTSYVSLRVAIFDPSYNLARGLPLNYNGTTSGWDKTLSTMPGGFKTFGRSVFFIVGFSVPINELTP